jgi:heat-inducible transcriptional repressor
VLSNGAVEKRSLEFSSEVNDAQLAAASAHLSAALVGHPAGSFATKMTATAIAKTGDPAIDTLCGAAVAALTGRQEGDGVFMDGTARMASAFDAVETVRQVLSILEQQYVVVTLLRDVLDRGLSVAIGTEHGLQSLADCSIVVAPYQVEGEPAGTVGVLGPTRMRYEQALAAVAVVSKRLGKALTEG